MSLFRSRSIPAIQPSKEMQLLLQCARTRLDEGTEARIRELASGKIDWSGLRALAHRHRVMPLLYRSLYKTCPEQVPEGALAALRQDYQTNAARNLMLTHELLNVLVALELGCIPAVAYKGPVLAQTAYGDTAFRQFEDLDILIRENHLWAVRDLLTSVGFIPVPPFDRFSDENYLHEQGEFKFKKNGRDVFLEIHWHVITRPFSYRPEFDDLYRRHQWIQIMGRRIASLSPEDMLLTLCAHGTQEGWSKLSAICDISELIHRAPNLDWEYLASGARSHSVQRILKLGLLLASNLLGVELPEIIANKMNADRTAWSLAMRVGAELCQDESTGHGVIVRTLMKIRAREGFRKRLTYGLRVLFTPSVEDWSIVDLPSSLWFLYSILRPFRIGFQVVLGYLTSLRSATELQLSNPKIS